MATKINNIVKTNNPLKRFVLDTPKFFKKVIIFCLGAAAAGIALKQLPEVAHIPLTPFLEKISDYLIAAGGIGSLVSKFTVDWDQIKKKAEKSNPETPLV